MAVAGMGCTAAAIAPALLASTDATFLPADAPSHVPFSGLTLRYATHAHGTTLLVRNETREQISVLELSPGYIETPDGEISLHGLIGSGNLIVPANATQAYEVTDNQKFIRYAWWTHVTDPTRHAQTHSTQFVSVVTRAESAKSDTLKLYSAGLSVG